MLLNRAEGLIAAARCLPRHQPRGSNVASAAGLAYERKVVAALARTFADVGFDLSHNPWFEFEGKFGTGVCCPDILVAPQTGPFAGRNFCIEVKLTYVDSAIEKLRDVYCPVVAMAIGEPVMPVVICKNMTAGAPKAYHTFRDAVETLSNFPLIHWLGVRPLMF